MNTIGTKTRFLCLIFAGLISLPFRGYAGYDIYLSMSGLSGEGTNGLIVLNSIQWSVGRAVTAPAGGTTRQASVPSFSELTLTKVLDSASPQLAFQAVSGTNGATCIVTVNDHNTGNMLYTLTLTGAVFSGYSFSSGGDRPSESISINYTTIEWVYRKLDNSGNIIAGSDGAASAPLGWNLAQQKPL